MKDDVRSAVFSCEQSAGDGTMISGPVGIRSQGFFCRFNIYSSFINSDRINTCLKELTEI